MVVMLGGLGKTRCETRAEFGVVDKEQGEEDLDFFQKPESFEGSLQSGMRDGCCNWSAWV